MPVVAAQYSRSATATRSGSPYTGPCRSLFPFVHHGASPVAFLLRDVSHKASSDNNLTASTREVARLIVATCRLRHRSEPGHVRPLRPDLGLLGQGRRVGLLGRSGPCGCCPFLHLSRPSLGPSRRDCSCRTGSERSGPRPVGTAVLRPNYISPNL